MKFIKALLLTLTLLVFPAFGYAQGSTKSITTAGADCSLDTSCAVFGVKDYPSIGVYLNVGTTGTFNFEATTSSTLSTAVWFGITDDIGGAGSATADGAFFFSNPGYSFIRIRASAISGDASVTTYRGFTGLRSTATLSGAAQGDGAIQDGANNTIEATVRDYANANPVAVALTDANGDIITNVGGGTEYTEGNTDASITGHAILFESNTGTNTLSVVSNTTPLPISDAGGALTVDNGGTFAVQAAQDGTWNITNISGTVSLPTGASTAAKQPALGTAGSASADVITVQGIASMTPILTTTTLSQSGTNNDVDANITNTSLTVRLQDGTGNALTSAAAGATRSLHMHVIDSAGNIVSSFGGSGGTASAFGAAFPSGASSGTAAGYNDGSNMQGARVFDLDTGAGTQYGLGVNLRRAASGGSAELIGSATSANSIPVVIASDQGSFTVTANAGSGTFAVSAASLPLPTGAATLAEQQTQTTALQLIDDLPVAQSATTSGKSGVLVQGAVSTGNPTYTNGQTNPLSLTTAGLLRVDASGTTQPVSDGGSSLTVDGTVAISTFPSNVPMNVAQMNGVAVTMGNGASGAGVQRVTIANDSTGVIASITSSITPGTGASNLGKAEDGVHSTGDVGLAMLTKRTDTAGTSATSDGDYATLNTDSNGRVWANVFGVSQVATAYLTARLSDGTNYVAPGTDYTHDAALTVASTAGPLMTGRASAAAPTNVSADDDAVLAWFTRAGAQVVNLSASGTLITSTSSSLNVNCTGGCTSTSISDDSTFTFATTSVVPVAGVFDNVGTDSVDENDVGAIRMSANRNMYTNIRDAAGNERGANVNTSNELLTAASQTGTWNITNISGTVSLPTGASTAAKQPALGTAGSASADVITVQGIASMTPLFVTGSTAHDAAASSTAPLLIGAYASQAAPTDVSADTDSVRLWALRNGSLVTNLAAGGTLITSTSSSLNVNVTNTSLTSVGAAAHDAPVSGNPVLLGAYASAAIPSAISADGDTARLWSGTRGQLAVMLVDSSGNAAALGGGTQFAEDVASADGQVGTVAMAVRQASPANTSDADGDYEPLRVNNGRLWASTVLTDGTDTALIDGSGNLAVSCTNCSGSGVSVNEDVASADAHPGTPAYTVRNDTVTGATTTDGDYQPIKSDSAGRIYVTGTGGVFSVTNAGTFAVQVDGSALTALQLIDDAVQTEDGAHSSGHKGMLGLGRRVDTLAASADASGDYETLNMAADGALYAANVGATNGGGTSANGIIASAASTNATNVKASAGQVYNIFAVNTTATVYYLRLYNLSSTPTCSSATGFVGSIAIPANTSGAGIAVPFPVGWAFNTGIGYCITGGAGSTDNTNAAVGIYGAIVYK